MTLNTWSTKLKKLKKVEPLEKDIENAFVRWCRGQGIKTVKPQVPSWPDRFVFMHDGTLALIEFKRPGKHLTPNQFAVKSALRVLGFEVHVCHSKQEAIDAIRFETAVNKKV